VSAPGLAWIASLDDEDLDALALRLRGRGQPQLAAADPGSLELISVREAAEAVGVCEETIRRKVKAGELPNRRIGGRIRIYRSDLLALLACEPTAHAQARASLSRRRRASDVGAMAEAFAQLR
jgi:excisionase family DNA binding protein